MDAIMHILEAAFKPLVFVFSVSNLFYMGLQVKIPDVVAVLKNKKTLALILVWGWVVGPALAYLIVWILPLSEPYVIGLLLYSLAPVAPFLPVMVGKARGRGQLRGRPYSNCGGCHSGFHAIGGAADDQGADGQLLGSRKSAPHICTRSAGTRSSNPALRGIGGNEDPSGGRSDRQDQHTVDKYGFRRVTFSEDDRNGGQLCPALHDNPHGRNRMDNVSIRFRLETESAQRHVAGYAHT